MLSASRNKKDGKARRQAAIATGKGLVLCLSGLPPSTCREDSGGKGLWRHPADSRCTLSPSSSSHQVAINSLNPSHQMNSMSLAPLAPVCFVSVQTACLGPKGGTFLYLLLHLCFSQEAPLQFFQRILQTLESSMGNTEGLQQECRPGHNAWGTAEEGGMRTAGPMAQTGRLY